MIGDANMSTLEPTFPKFRSALLAWWLAAVTAAAGKVDALLAIESDAERGALVPFYFPRIAQSLPEWHELNIAASGYDRLKEQIGHEVGSGLWGGTMLTLDRVVSPFLTKGTELLFEHDLTKASAEETFQSVYKRIEDYLAKESLVYDVYVPLIGLVCDEPPIVLDSATSLELLDERDPSHLQIKLLLVDRATIVEDDLPLPAQYRTRLHLRYELPKKIGPDTVDPELGSFFYSDVETRVRDCLRALALLTFMRIIAWPAQVREEALSLGDTRGLSLDAPQIVTKFYASGATVGTEQVPELVRFWNIVRHPNFGTHATNRAVGFTLDRLAGLGSKPADLGDQVVDAVVACESFFTLGQASNRLEIAYRVSNAVAQMSPLLKADMPKALVFYAIKCAYNIRSRVVHGSELRAEHFNFKGAPSGLATLSRANQLNYFIWIVAELTRRGIVYAIGDAAPGDEIRVDWDAILFGQ